MFEAFLLCVYSDVHKLKKELPLDAPPPPPSSRRWRGSAVAPYGSNTMLVLYKCSHTETSVLENVDNFLVQVIHNERSVALQVLRDAICFILWNHFHIYLFIYNVLVSG
jgi:hypothetical protein